MKNLIKYLCLVICLFFVGCSNVDAVKVQEKAVITQEQKTLLLQINETELSSMLYNYFDSNGWKIQEHSDTINTNATKPTFSIKYNLKEVSDPLLRAPLYSGYITIVDMRNGKLIASIRFKELNDSDIYSEIIDEFENNVEIKQVDEIEEVEVIDGESDSAQEIEE